MQQALSFLWTRRAVAAALCASAATVVPLPAYAHAILMDSEPAMRGTVPAGPVAVQFRYNSRIDAARSRLTLVRADRSQFVLPLAPGAPEDRLVSRVELPPGEYTLRWQVLAVDGHITRGDVPFRVVAP